jgi:5-methylcytosine-specific restriction endonuclease McrA
MSRSKEYQHLLNSKEWLEVKRIVWRRAGGLCEQCKREGLIRAGKDCHHKVPVESANPDDPQAMRRLAYDINNIELLCVEHHIKVHKEMRSHKKDKVAENKARARARFLERNSPSWQPSNGEQAEAHLATIAAASKEEEEKGADPHH